MKNRIPRIDELLAPNFKRTEATTRTNYEFEAILIQVKDGDTVEVYLKLGMDKSDERFVVRLAGINCPETNPKLNKSKKLIAIGEKAKLRTTELLDNPLCKIITKKVEFDPRGRFVAEVINDKGQNINQTLIDEKLALPYDGSVKANTLDFTELTNFHFR